MPRAGAVVGFALAVGLSAGCAAFEPCSAGPECPRVLFIGNSYSAANDLPGMFADLARAGGHRVETGLAAEGGWTLADHLASARTQAQLTEAPWTYVVLQEQSQIPAAEVARAQSLYPAARGLVGRIMAAGAQPLLFLTWAHRGGWPANGLPDYPSMQAQIDVGYLTLAQDLSIPVAPVGYAWGRWWQAQPGFDLWQADGSHPAPAGTYLAACVFYAVIFRESPVGLAYPATVPAEVAPELQALAASTVLAQPEQWHLPEVNP